VYEWAGQLRTIDISKGGNRFAHHAYIENAAAPTFCSLRRKSTSRDSAPMLSAIALPGTWAN